jgi:hypothetical protein
MEQGWVKENPARKIKKVAPEQDETPPFTREQYDALIEATWIYDSRDGKKNGDTVNARRARTYLKLLRWSGLRAGDAACLSRDELRDDDSLFLYQKKVKGKASSAVYGGHAFGRGFSFALNAPFTAHRRIVAEVLVNSVEVHRFIPRLRDHSESICSPRSSKHSTARSLIVSPIP